MSAAPAPPSPPIDNDHVAPGATPFTREEIAFARRAYLEELVAPIMAAGIDAEMPAIPERLENPMHPAVVERREYTRRLAHAAFRLIPNFALSFPAAAPPGLEEAVEGARRLLHENGFVYASEAGRRFDIFEDATNVAAALVALTRGDGRELGAATRCAEDGSAIAPSTDCNPKE